MKKKGFTLVELLAAIVILAVVLVISAPQIMNMIRQTRLKAMESSAKLIVKNAEQDYLLQKTLNESYSAATISCPDVAKLSDDYEICTIEYDDEGMATVTLAGKTGGKFDGMICTATRTNVSCEIGILEDIITVTFDANGGTTPINSKKLLPNTTYGGLPTPTREGYTFMGWSKSNLPDGYQEVEYIESTGTQYIDTNVIPTSNLNGEFTLSANAYGYPFGSTNGQDKDYWGMNFNCNGQYQLYYGTGSYPMIGIWQLNTKYIIKINNKKFYLNNELLYDFNNGSNTFTFNTNSTIYLFALNYNGVSYSQFKMYNVKLWQNNTLVRDFVPCYRISDNVIGMYDTVNGVFYTNQGTGSFNKGSNVNNFVTSTTQVVTSTTPVTTNEDHTLYARWE